MRIAQDLSIVLFMGALLGILIHLYQGGMVSAGDFAMLLNVALGTFQITWHLADQGAFFAEEWGRCAQALTLIATPHEIADARGAASLEVSAGRIEF
jgi:ATP-binding cassette subfamily B protein